MFVRHAAASMIEALADSRVVFLNGARQVGKSTLAKWLTDNGFEARYLTLDNAGVLAAASHDPAAFIEGLDGPVVLDEIQRVPELFLPIKARVDRDPRPGQFLLTGSANVLLLPQAAELLAGRMEILTLWPLSQGELASVRETFVDRILSATPPKPVAKVPDRVTVLSAALVGGYPAAVARPTAERRRAWFGSYLNAILQRDIRDLANIEGLVELPRLLSLLAARTTSLVNFASLARDIALPQTTLKRYMALLEMTFLLHRLPAWSANLGQRLVKSPKLFLNDTGLMAYLLGLNERRLADEPMLLGPLVENFALVELFKQTGWSAAHPKLFHFRTHTGQEVDLILEEASGTLVGVEIKASASVQAADFKGLRSFAELAGARFRRGVVLYLGQETIAFGTNLYAIPLGALWSVA